MGIPPLLSSVGSDAPENKAIHPGGIQAAVRIQEPGGWTAVLTTTGVPQFFFQIILFRYRMRTRIVMKNVSVDHRKKGPADESIF